MSMVWKGSRLLNGICSKSISAAPRGLSLTYGHSEANWAYLAGVGKEMKLKRKGFKYVS